MALGPSLRVSLFRLGCELAALFQVGIENTEIHIQGEELEDYSLEMGFGLGPGFFATWQNISLRQQTLLGYGLNGYQHEMRLGLGVAF